MAALRARRDVDGFEALERQVERHVTLMLAATNELEKLTDAALDRALTAAELEYARAVKPPYLDTNGTRMLRALFEALLAIWATPYLMDGGRWLLDKYVLDPMAMSTIGRLLDAARKLPPGDGA
jgi:hypothetical protein